MSNRFFWETIRTEQIADCKVFSVAKNVACVPGPDAQSHNFYVLHPQNWVNVIAITDDNQVVMVEQFRHGTGELTLEIPGGMVDPEDIDPEYAARRELREETGFEAGEFIHLGRNHPNPALQSNLCDTFLTRGAIKVAEPRFDSTEYVELRLVPLHSIPDLIMVGRITHALVIVAFHYLHLYESNAKERHQLISCKAGL